VSVLETLQSLLTFLQEGRPIAVVTLVGSSGSIPNAVGAKMIVGAQGERLAGTVGGGEIELMSLSMAAEAIAQRKSRLGSYHLTEKHAHGIGMMCGGTVQVFIEVHVPSPRVVLVGAGHVNIEIARLARPLGYPVIVIDERPEWANPANYPDCTIIPQRAAAGMAQVDWLESDYLLVATADADTESLRAALTVPCGYVGLVASKRKTIQILKNLAAEGHDLSGLTPRLRAPVGLNLGGKEPVEIALSVMAEIHAHRNGRDALPLSYVEKIPRPERLRADAALAPEATTISP
jgi:xanthine dehydrogenase accessory factor